MSDGLTELAWGGIELRVPCGWEPARVGRDRLVLATGDRPVMEIKWRAGERPTAVERTLRRLAREVRREGGGWMQRQPLPPEWQDALPARDGVAYAWHAAGRRAIGACLRCRECGTVCLVQFYGLEWSDARAAAVLGSLADHRPAGDTRWRLFDIDARLPRGFRLVDSAFRPGRFELLFRQARLTLTLYRWAPAAALLGGGSLMEFARSAVPEAVRHFTPATVVGYEGAVSADPRPGGIARLAGRLGWGRRQAVRVWHVPGVNRIMGARLEGPGRDLEPMLEGICDRYGVDEGRHAGAASARP